MEVELSPAEKIRNNEIFQKIVASFLEPVFIWILFNYFGLNPLAWICGIIWLIGNLIILFYDKDTAIISLCKKVLNI